MEVGTYSTATLVGGAKRLSHGSDRPQSNLIQSRASRQHRGAQSALGLQQPDLVALIVSCDAN
jgi:hypothetical protein